jgi:hypothetical protein
MLSFYSTMSGFSEDFSEVYDFNLFFGLLPDVSTFLLFVQGLACYFTDVFVL